MLDINTYSNSASEYLNYQSNRPKKISANKVIIVIPCYNESDRLKPRVFLNFLKLHQNVKFLFVNDGSIDDTLVSLGQMKALNPSNVEILDLVQNSGKAEAVRQGLILASQLGSDYVGYWDADLATPLDAIEDFMRVAKRLPEVEVIYGARKSMLGHRIDRKLSRRIVSRICANLARFAVNMPISDTQCGAKIFRNNQNLFDAVSKKFTAGWLFDVELFARLSANMNNKTNKFFEFALVEWSEIPGSKIDIKAILKSGLVMLKLIGSMRFRFSKKEVLQHA